MPTLFAAKVALASFFLRIFSIKKMLRISIWVTIAWSAFVSLFALLWSVGACHALGIAYAACGNKSYHEYEIAAALNIVTDLALLVIPIWGIFSLQMQTQRKLALSLIFMAGIS